MAGFFENLTQSVSKAAKQASDSAKTLADKSRVNWLQSYFTSPWYAKPGESYRYINENIYVLAAVIATVKTCVSPVSNALAVKPLWVNAVPS